MNAVLAERTLTSGQIVQIVRGDITAERVDAIVNAANSHLQHGGGVARVISEKGGPTIQRESDAWIREHGPVSHAHPAWTSGGRLPAKYVIHAVGPVWGEGDEDRKLAEAVNGALRVAGKLHCASLAMPAISTGIFGFPKERAAKVILESIEIHFQHSPSSLQTVRIVLFDPSSVDAFLKQWQGKEAGQV